MPLSMESSDFKLYSTFSSWDEFDKAAKAYIDNTFQPFVKASTKRVEAQNKKCKEKYPISMEYYYKMYSCSHRGKFAPRGLGIRKTKSQKDGCIAKIRARLDSKDKNKIVVTVLDERHNHEIGEHIYKKYAHNRCLTQEEKEHVNKLCSLNVPNKDMRREIELLTGKKVTLQDISNSKKSFRRKIKDAVHRDDVQLLQPKLEPCERNDPGWHHNYYITVQPSEVNVDWSPETQSKKDKYSIAKPKLDNLLKKLLEVDTASFNFYMDRLDEVDMCIRSSSEFSVSRLNTTNSDGVSSYVINVEDASSGGVTSIASVSGVVDVANVTGVVDVASVSEVVSIASGSDVMDVPSNSLFDKRNCVIEDVDAKTVHKALKRARSKDLDAAVIGLQKRLNIVVEK